MNELPALGQRRRKNPTHRPRNDGYRWNVSQIAAALNFHRDTVRRHPRVRGYWQGRELAAGFDQRVRHIMVDESRPGGMLYNLIKK